MVRYNRNMKTTQTTTTLKTPAGYRTLSPGAVEEAYGKKGYGYVYEPTDYEGDVPFSRGFATLQQARQAAYNHRDLNGESVLNADGKPVC